MNTSDDVKKQCALLTKNMTPNEICEALKSLPFHWKLWALGRVEPIIFLRWNSDGTAVLIDLVKLEEYLGNPRSVFNEKSLPTFFEQLEYHQFKLVAQTIMNNGRNSIQVYKNENFQRDRKDLLVEMVNETQYSVPGLARSANFWRILDGSIQEEPGVPTCSDQSDKPKAEIIPPDVKPKTSPIPNVKPQTCPIPDGEPQTWPVPEGELSTWQFLDVESHWPIPDGEYPTWPYLDFETWPIPSVKAQTWPIPDCEPQPWSIPNVEPQTSTTLTAKAQNWTIPDGGPPTWPVFDFQPQAWTNQNVQPKTWPIPNFQPQTLPIPDVKAQIWPIPDVKAQTWPIPDDEPQTWPIPDVQPQNWAIPDVKDKTWAIPDVEPESSTTPDAKSETPPLPDFEPQSWTNSDANPQAWPSKENFLFHIRESTVIDDKGIDRKVVLLDPRCVFEKQFDFNHFYKNRMRLRTKYLPPKLNDTVTPDLIADTKSRANFEINNDPDVIKTRINIS